MIKIGHSRPLPYKDKVVNLFKSTQNWFEVIPIWATLGKRLTEMSTFFVLGLLLMFDFNAM